MNLKQLRKQIGTYLLLRPLPTRIKADGNHLLPSDDDWLLEAILENPNRIRLVNISTHHIAEIQPDNVREYRSPNFLLLRSQLIIKGPNLTIEPIVGNSGVGHVRVHRRNR